MTPAEVAAKLRAFNEWRRGGDIDQPGPLAVGEAIDAAVEMIDRLEAAEKDVAMKEEVIDSLAAVVKRLDAQCDAAEKERDALRAKVEQMERQEPVAKVRVHRTGGNAGLAWSVAPLNDFDSLPLMRDGDRLYAFPGAKGE